MQRDTKYKLPNDGKIRVFYQKSSKDYLYMTIDGSSFHCIHIDDIYHFKNALSSFRQNGVNAGIQAVGNLVDLDTTTCSVYS